MLYSFGFFTFVILVHNVQCILDVRRRARHGLRSGGRTLRLGEPRPYTGPGSERHGYGRVRVEEHDHLGFRVQLVRFVSSLGITRDTELYSCHHAGIITVYI